MKALLAKSAAKILGGLKSDQFQQIWTWIKEAAKKQLSSPEKFNWVVSNVVSAIFGPDKKWLAQGVVQLVFIWAKLSGLLNEENKPTEP
jgi:hypothetical protein